LNALEIQYEESVIAVVSQYIALASKFSTEQTLFQNNLELEEIFHPTALLSSTARKDSRGKVDRLTAMFEKYKQFYDAYVIGINKSIISLQSDLPEARQKEISATMMSQMQDKLIGQAYFYELRQRWIDAVIVLLDFFDGKEETIRYDEDELWFDNDDEYDCFNTVAAEINEIAEKETELMNGRINEIRQQTETMGLTL